VYYVISKILLSAVIKSTIHDVLRVLGPKNHDEASLRVHIFRSLFETFERYGIVTVGSRESSGSSDSKVVHSVIEF